MPENPAPEAPSVGPLADPDIVPASLPTPINVRSLSLAVIALLACVFTLHWAREVFIPLLLGVMLSYALSPLVDQFQRWRLPRVVGAAAVLVAILAGLGSIAWSVSDDASAMLQSLPAAAQKLQEAVRPARGAPASTLDKVQQAAARLEQAAEEGGAAATPAARGVTRVQIERPRLNVQDYLWSGTLGLARMAVMAAVVFFIAFFLMSSGDGFRRKIVKIAGPTFAKRRVTVQVLDQITLQIQRYLAIQVFTSTLVGLVTWAALLAFGLERAAVWGLVAGVLNLVPYLGAVATAGGLALVAFLQFGSFGMAALIGGVSMVINTLEGNLLTPWLTGRASSMNPVVIFVGVLAFGWLWGIWGLLLGTPLIMALKSVCDHVDDLKPLGELLGE
jgi:predicted PurR-regulated permease PerM